MVRKEIRDALTEHTNEVVRITINRVEGILTAAGVKHRECNRQDRVCLNAVIGEAWPKIHALKREQH